MKKRQVRCFKRDASLSGEKKIEIFYCLPDFGYNGRLFTCINCGEIFFIDFENPEFAGKSFQRMALGHTCVKCKKLLAETLREYPENFILENGQIGHFDYGSSYPLDSESIIKEFWEIK